MPQLYISVPLWHKVAAEVALVMCSSASVERVFSLLNCMFDDHQQRFKGRQKSNASDRK
jgi:hypothetical protein